MEGSQVTIDDILNRLRNCERILLENDRYRDKKNLYGASFTESDIDLSKNHAKDFSDNTNLSWMEHFSSKILSGIFPDAKVLLHAAICFDKYLSSQGKLSLDDSFGLKSKKKSGNPARRRARRNEDNINYYEMRCYLADNPGSTQEKAAEEAAKINKIDTGIKKDIDSIARGFRASKWKDASVLSIPKAGK